MKIFSFFIFFFLFNIPYIDSNSTKRLIYNINDLSNIEYNTIYFKNANSNDLENIINKLNLSINYFIVDNKKYYVRNINILLEEYTKNKSLEDKLFNKINGIKIDGIKVKCSNEDLIELEKLFNIY